jgi:hypothetical protein
VLTGFIGQQPSKTVGVMSRSLGELLNGYPAYVDGVA